ncbi:WD40 repeat domain-containing protein [Actinobacillus equuli]|uniref:WD40 repeat domain-containing protein n=1 Tax=Actinobacillus equuli TaxID=718 RepID=UPI0024423996|nr:WD40 repeat domain-containing protein [Actinobacillus equuli]WGE47073.1 WD40 repeat domain-containing protein [Actinobacillus equuli subsp. haemolyticus]
MIKNRLIKAFIAIFGVSIVSFFAYQYHRTEPIISLAISSDGRYVISIHGVKEFFSFRSGQQLILWDIEKKEKKVLAENAVGFTSAFVPNSHEFMWQDDKNVVHIQNVEGKEVLSFPHFPVRTHIISADKTFYLFSNDEDYGQLYKGYGKDLVPVYTDGGYSIPLTLSMSENHFLSASNGYLPENAPATETNLTANPINPSESKKDSYIGVTLWDRHTLKPVARLYGNAGKSTGVISPDGNWVVTGGENLRDFMWETHHLTNRQRLASYDRGIYQEETESFDKSKLLSLPDKFKNKQMGLNNTIAIAFLSEKDFVLLDKSSDIDGIGNELARLYTVGDPWIKAYVEIGNNPSISTNGYGKHLSVSSAPKAHILVTGQATGGGINVYKYHPDKMELEKIWVAD